MSTGTNLMNRCLIALSKAGATVWRNTTASGWAGKSFSLSPGEVYRARGGERVVLNAYPIKAGLCTGSGDIIGAYSIVITPEMVGRRVAVFGTWEVKDGTGRPSKEQAHFAGFIADAGGIGTIIRSEAEALESIKAYRGGQ
ncbi:MAG: hypothetical protein E5V92_22115 [Mesorhizobium sp.]|nr:MAG: hypothetical protein E5V92_22115 [Mesorhizobium sp.]